MKYYKDLEGTIPCKHGDRAAVVKMEIPDELLNHLGLTEKESTIWHQKNPRKRPIYKSLESE